MRYQRPQYPSFSVHQALSKWSGEEQGEIALPPHEEDILEISKNQSCLTLLGIMEEAQCRADWMSPARGPAPGRRHTLFDMHPGAPPLSRLSGQSQNLSCGWGILTLLFLLPAPQGSMFLSARFISESKCLMCNLTMQCLMWGDGPDMGCLGKRHRLGSEMLHWL